MKGFKTKSKNCPGRTASGECMLIACKECIETNCVHAHWYVEQAQAKVQPKKATKKGV